MKKILLFALLTTFSTNAQTPSDHVTGFLSPTGIAFDNTGNLYVADFNSYNVIKITPNLVKTSFNSLNGTPQQIAFDINGNLWIAGSGLISEIRKVTPTGVATSYMASNAPYGIAIDAAGNVYYSELNSGKIKKIEAVNGAVSTFADRIYLPSGMVFDKSGNLIVAVKGDNEIRKITPNGVASTLITGIRNPSNLLYTPNGDLYISTGSQGSIFRFPAGSADEDPADLYLKLNSGDSAGQMTFYNGALYISSSSGDSGKVIKITDPMLGLKDVNNVADNFIVYPNPATEYLVIKNSKVDLKTIQLFDMAGREVKNFKPSEIKDNKIILSNLTSGNYILKVNNTSKKIIIK